MTKSKMKSVRYEDGKIPDNVVPPKDSILENKHLVADTLKEGDPEKAKTVDMIRNILGLCRRAGRLVIGTELVCLAMAKKPRPCLIVIAEDASEKTLKKLKTKAEFYSIPHKIVPVSTEQLGHAIGKMSNIAGCAITEPNLAGRLCTVNSIGKDSSVNAEDRS